MVGDAIEECAGEPLADEHRGLFLERQIEGEDGGAVLVAPAENVEQEFVSGRRRAGTIIPPPFTIILASTDHPYFATTRLYRTPPLYNPFL